MIKKLLLLSLILSVGLIAQPGKLFWDGYNWQELDRLTREYPEFGLPMKRAYVRGLLNGKVYHYLQVWTLDASLADTLFRDSLSRCSLDELIRGTDQFYQDPRNLYLPVITALIITSLRITDIPDSVIVEYTQAARDWINGIELYTMEQVPVDVGGISKPTLPQPPHEVYLPPPKREIKKWYNPEELILP
jgi:hypothetical protein